MIHECYLFKCEISGFLLIMSTLGLSQVSSSFLLLNSGTLFSYLIVKYMTADSWFLGNNPEREKIQKAIFYLDFVWMLLDILYESVWILECLCWQSCWKLAWSIGPLLVGNWIGNSVLSVWLSKTWYFTPHRIYHVFFWKEICHVRDARTRKFGPLKHRASHQNQCRCSAKSQSCM